MQMISLENEYQKHAGIQISWIFEHRVFEDKE